MEVVLVVAVVAIVALYIAARRAITIALLKIEHGKVEVVHGGIAPPVLADIRDVAAKPPIHSAQVRITRSSGRAETTISGDVSEQQSQRLRNVIGSVPLARLINARRR